VVGEVVDAETLVKDDEIVNDQVLTYSDAYIPKHTKVSERNEGGLFRVTIRAVVERRKLVVKLKAANVALKGMDGQSMFGNIVSQLENEKDAAALLRNTLEGFPQNCVTADVVGEPKIVQKDEQKATLRFQVQVRPDLNAYKSFATRLQRTLQSIAKDQGEFLIPFQRQVAPKAPQFEWFWASNSTGHFFAACMPKFADRSTNEVRLRTDVVNVALATQTTRTSEQLQGHYFLLDKSVSAALVATASHAREGELALLDASGEAIVADRFPLFERHPDRWRFGYQGSLIASLGHGEARFFLVTPVFMREGSGETRNEDLHYRLSLSIVRDITLTLDEIKTIDKVRCEIRF